MVNTEFTPAEQPGSDGKEFPSAQPSQL